MLSSFFNLFCKTNVPNIWFTDNLLYPVLLRHIIPIWFIYKSEQQSLYLYLQGICKILKWSIRKIQEERHKTIHSIHCQNDNNVQIIETKAFSTCYKAENVIIWVRHWIRLVLNIQRIFYASGSLLGHLIVMGHCSNANG